MVGKKYVIQQQPILPYVYYKNFEKVKIILIESDNKPIQQYLELLATIKRHASGTLKFLGPSEFIEFERFTEQETIEVANEIREVYYNITKNLNEKIIVFTNIYPFILKKQEFNKNICKELYLL